MDRRRESGRRRGDDVEIGGEEVLSMTAHELQTPIAALTLQLQSLDGVVSDECAGKKLRRALRSTARLSELVDGILGLTRARAGKLELARESIDLFDLVLDVVDRVRDQATHAGCELSLIAADVVEGEWDRLRLEIVVTNLITNAIKYGAGKPIDVVVEASGDAARLTIRDHGCGIGPEEQKTIFDRYKRASGAQGVAGVGLGLHISRSLVEAHGGVIRVVSTFGQGTSFQIELPRSPRQP